MPVDSGHLKDLAAAVAGVGKLSDIGVCRWFDQVRHRGAAWLAMRAHAYISTTRLYDRRWSKPEDLPIFRVVY